MRYAATAAPAISRAADDRQQTGGSQTGQNNGSNSAAQQVQDADQQVQDAMQGVDSAQNDANNANDQAGQENDLVP